MNPYQFKLSSILLLTFAVAALLALVVQTGPFVANLILVVLLANFVGVIVALVVTFVLRFPRDGSQRQAKWDDELDPDSPPRS